MFVSQFGGDYIYKKKILSITPWMATGSIDGARRQTLNAKSAHYRTMAVHLEKGLPVLVGDDANVVRIRWGGEPHRKANLMGKEFSVTADPPNSPTH